MSRTSHSSNSSNNNNNNNNNGKAARAHSDDDDDAPIAQPKPQFSDDEDQQQATQEPSDVDDADYQPSGSGSGSDASPRKRTRTHEQHDDQQDDDENVESSLPQVRTFQKPNPPHSDSDAESDHEEAQNMSDSSVPAARPAPPKQRKPQSKPTKNVSAPAAAASGSAKKNKSNRASSSSSSNSSNNTASSSSSSKSKSKNKQHKRISSAVVSLEQPHEQQQQQQPRKKQRTEEVHSSKTKKQPRASSESPRQPAERQQRTPSPDPQPAAARVRTKPVVPSNRRELLEFNTQDGRDRVWWSKGLETCEPMLPPASGIPRHLDLRRNCDLADDGLSGKLDELRKIKVELVREPSDAEIAFAASKCGVPKAVAKILKPKAGSSFETMPDILPICSFGGRPPTTVVLVDMGIPLEITDDNFGDQPITRERLLLLLKHLRPYHIGSAYQLPQGATDVQKAVLATQPWHTFMKDDTVRVLTPAFMEVLDRLWAPLLPEDIYAEDLVRTGNFWLGSRDKKKIIRLRACIYPWPTYMRMLCHGEPAKARYGPGDDKHHWNEEHNIGRCVRRAADGKKIGDKERKAFRVLELEERKNCISAAAERVKNAQLTQPAVGGRSLNGTPSSKLFDELKEWFALELQQTKDWFSAELKHVVGGGNSAHAAADPHLAASAAGTAATMSHAAPEAAEAEAPEAVAAASSSEDAEMAHTDSASQQSNGGTEDLYADLDAPRVEQPLEVDGQEPRHKDNRGDEEAKGKNAEPDQPRHPQRRTTTSSSSASPSSPARKRSSSSSSSSSGGKSSHHKQSADPQQQQQQQQHSRKKSQHAESSRRPPAEASPSLSAADWQEGGLSSETVTALGLKFPPGDFE
jgi:hypothetical protein